MWMSSLVSKSYTCCNSRCCRNKTNTFNIFESLCIFNFVKIDLWDKIFILLYNPLSANVYMLISMFLIIHVYYQYLLKKYTTSWCFLKISLKTFKNFLSKYLYQIYDATKIWTTDLPSISKINLLSFIFFDDFSFEWTKQRPLLNICCAPGTYRETRCMLIYM